MSRHKTLKCKDNLARHRNVLTRAERVEHLRESGRWVEGSSVVGMAKVGHRKASVGKKVKEKKGEEATDEKKDDAAATK